MRSGAPVHKQADPIQWDSTEQRKERESWYSEAQLGALMPQHSTAETNFLKEIPDSQKIFLNNVDKQASYPDVFHLLRPFGLLLRLNLPMSKKTKKNRGYGYAIFDDRGSVTRLMELNGSIGFGDRMLIFERFARRKKASPWGEPIRERIQTRRDDFRPSHCGGGFGKKPFEYEEEGSPPEHLQQAPEPHKFGANQPRRGFMGAGEFGMYARECGIIKPTQKGYFVSREGKEFRKHQMNRDNYRIRRWPTTYKERL